jgi:hypothetical protein
MVRMSQFASGVLNLGPYSPFVIEFRTAGLYVTMEIGTYSQFVLNAANFLLFANIFAITQ